MIGDGTEDADCRDVTLRFRECGDDRLLVVSVRPSPCPSRPVPPVVVLGVNEVDPTLLPSSPIPSLLL